MHSTRTLISAYMVFCCSVYMSVQISHSLLARSKIKGRNFRHFIDIRSTNSFLFSTTKSANTRMADQSPPIVVVIAGPTATGKSDVAAKLCAQQKGMIISADSVQAYRGVQIGANKPDLEERKKTPHILIDVADRLENYNAAEWREDAIYCIHTLLGRGKREQEFTSTTSSTSSNRRTQIQEYIKQSRIEKGYDNDNTRKEIEAILPVVCGGTMMYLQWLVHGRPDAMRPTPNAVEISHKTMLGFQEKNNDFDSAVKHVASFGKVFADRAQNLTSGDWYRLRRTLEIALTVEEKQKDNVDRNENVDANKVNKDYNLAEQLFSGERQDSLASLGFDVRCFFLCPDDRMNHTRVVDNRCEQMLIKGLLKETTELSLTGCLPEMAERAIGYRQTLNYLDQKNNEGEKDQPTEEEAFEIYLNEFKTATRRYAKKQMAWFRNDKDFMFIPVPLKLGKRDRIAATTADIIRLCQLSRVDFERELFSCDNSISKKAKELNEKQGKTMKFYKPEKHILTPGSRQYEEVLTEAIECRRLFRSSKYKRRRREDVENTNR
eukprot:CAMPEP_0197198356 /NCGR_PEP_ID=MMETSP1423-20130617/33329_1 /TAXON_ID=476441 /ORGANISM="Pseudo-nitzschia heimii, Strain UNC1101" /LENGTH=548 /DNA_ID=CAMNT_0042652187 /DNA_START=1 /DNA_END=1647 /DNA_ORIENTATION=+